MSNILSAIGYGGTVAIIGMLIVFFVLALLIACIYALGAVMQKMTGEKKAKTAAPAPAPAPAATADDLDEFDFEATENTNNGAGGNLFDMFIKKK